MKNKWIRIILTFGLVYAFSCEKDFLEPNMQSLKVTGFIINEYFVDIGIPEDYYKANKELENIIKF